MRIKEYLGIPYFVDDGPPRQVYGIDDPMPKKKTVRQRFMLTNDNDGHWYMIPVENQDAWEVYCNLDPDIPESWNAPQWARPLQGSPSRVTFENPAIS